MLAVLASWCSSDAQGGATTRVSVASGGTQGNGASHQPAISADGRFVAFESFATNLAGGDTNGWSDVFVRDRQAKKTNRASVATGGKQGHGESWGASISGDGRFVAFASSASDLVAGDTNGCWDVFVHDQQTGQTTRVSIASDGTEANGLSYGPSISADGRFVAFTSFASNLVAGDTNGDYDVFVHDRDTGQTTRVSVASGGTEANEGSYDPSISADGQLVAFHSFARNLVAGDTNGASDVFVHDRQTGGTTRVSVASGGTEGDSASGPAAISGGGRFVAFDSEADNLVAGDTNHYGDVFVHDRQTGETTRVSVAGDGTQGNSWSTSASISADGRLVAFRSLASNLVPRDTNGCEDVFVYDRQLGRTTRVSVVSDGKQGNAASKCPSISSDGRFVAFESEATNLVAGDTNRYADVFVREFTADLPRPDLQGCALAAPGSLFWGAAINVARQIKNAGIAAAGPFRIEWYLSQDAVGSTADDILLSRPGSKLAYYPHGGLAAGAKGTVNTVTLQLPPALPSGWSGTSFYLIMRTDSANVVEESNEKNNFGQMGDGLDRVPIQITAAVPEVTFPTLPGEVLLRGTGYTITWKEFIAPNVKIDLLKGAVLSTTIAASTPNDGSFLWTVPKALPIGSDYTVKITSTANAAIKDSSDNPFSIAP